MQKYKEKLEQILKGLAYEISDVGLAKLRELILFLQEFESMIKNEEVYETVNIGMFHGTEQVKNINWNVLFEKLEKLPTIEDEDRVHVEVDELFIKDEEYEFPEENKKTKPENIEGVNIEEIEKKLDEEEE